MKTLRTLVLPLCLPFLLAGSALAGGSSTRSAGAAEKPQDPGRELEAQLGVVGRNTAEGRELNDRLGLVVERIVKGVNAERKGEEEFRLCAARILGGKSEGDGEVNAFALPDGRIYVTLGLMRLLKDSPRRDDELAFVVGHEVTHVAERHSEHQMRKALPAGLVAVLLFAVSKNRTVGNLGALGAAAYASSFSRQDEYHADRGGLLAMHRAGYEPQAAAAMLQRLKEKGERQNRLLNGWFGSHPLTETRISRVRVMTDDLLAGRPVGDGTQRTASRQ